MERVVANKKDAKIISSRKPRHLKPAKVETVRERSAKNEQANPKATAQQNNLRALISGFFAPLRFVWRGLRWLGRHLIPRYFRNAFTELRQVTWPNRKQTRQLTTAVMLFAIVFAMFISILDFGLDKVFKRILLK